MLNNQYKQIFRYHPKIGYWYRKNINLRIQSQSLDKHYYRIITNKFGARCSHNNFSEKKKKKILFIGCSYAAGDGVSNGFRFTDLIEKESHDFKSFNYSLSGSGNDQQLIIKNIYEPKINPDILVFCPYVGCIGRNVQKARITYDQLRGLMVNRPKPFFELKKKGLFISKRIVPKVYIDPLNLHENNKESYLIKFTKNLYNISKNFVSKKKWLINDMYKHKNKTPYILTKSIIQEIIKSSNVKKKILMPLPSSRDCLSNIVPNYLNFYKLVTDELKNNNIIFFDILEDIKRLNKNEISSLFFEGDGHFTRYGHKLVAKSFLKKLDTVI